LSPAPASFLQVDAPDVPVENWTTAEDGCGTIFRLVEEGGKSANVHLSFPLFILREAWRANAVEENLEKSSVSPRSHSKVGQSLDGGRWFGGDTSSLGGE